MVIAAVGTVFAAGYLLWLFQRSAFGEPKPEWEGHVIADVNRYEWAAWTPLIIAMVLFGWVPGLIFGVVDDVSVGIAASISDAVVGS